MENASKALLMAGGVLIGILIMSLAVYLYIDFGQSAAEVNKQTADAQLYQFNSRFTVYDSTKSGTNEKIQWTIYDVITVAGFAYENNVYYGNPNGNDNDLDGYGIIVYLGNGNTEIQTKNQIIDNKTNLITNNFNNKYTCTIEQYHPDTGRVWKIRFKQV